MKFFVKAKRIAIFVLMFALTTFAKAQSSLAFYPLEDHFSSSAFNPAFLTSPKKFTFSIAPMGGTTIGYNNQAIIKDLLSQILSGVPTGDDYYREVLESLTSKNMFNQSIESSLLSFTMRTNMGFFNFRIKETESFSASAKGDLMSFILKEGIQSTVTEKIQDLPAQAVHFREYSLGYSYKSAMNRFSAGIRTKLYFGKAAMYSSLSGSVNNESGSYILKTNGNVNISFPEAEDRKETGGTDITKVSGTKIVDYLFNNGNVGLGVDLGFKYRFTPDISFSMSIIDLGKINWKTNLNTRKFRDFKLPESSYSIITDEIGVETIAKFDYAYSDSIADYLDKNIDTTSFSKPLPLTVYAGFKFRLNPKVTISLTDKLVLVQDLNYNSFSATANIDFKRGLSVSTGYSVIGDSYFNIPVAVFFKKDFGQIYFGTDNIASFILPSISDYASFSFGTCFYLFKNSRTRSNSQVDYPFFKPRKIKRYGKGGRIAVPYPES